MLFDDMSIITSTLQEEKDITNTLLVFNVSRAVQLSVLKIMLLAPSSCLLNLLLSLQLGLTHVCVILSRRRDTITSAWYYVSHRRDTLFEASNKPGKRSFELMEIMKSSNMVLKLIRTLVCIFGNFQIDCWKCPFFMPVKYHTDVILQSVRR